jgi:hypothetical protein
MSNPPLPPAPLASTASRPAVNQPAATQPSSAGSPQNNAQAQRKSQFHARLENQKAQLERHGNFAEVVIRTTPEGTDMINFARLWEHVLVQADRQTRGYVAKSSRGEFEVTRKDFDDCVEFMVQKIKSAVTRHKLDLAGTNFISRVAQRYGIADKVRKGSLQGAPLPGNTSAAAEKSAKVEASVAEPVAEEAAAAKPAKRPTRVSKKSADDDVDAL